MGKWADVGFHTQEKGNGTTVNGILPLALEEEIISYHHLLPRIA